MSLSFAAQGRVSKLASPSRAACSRPRRSPPATDRGRAAPPQPAMGRPPVSNRAREGYRGERTCFDRICDSGARRRHNDGETGVRFGATARPVYEARPARVGLGRSCRRCGHRPSVGAGRLVSGSQLHPPRPGAGGVSAGARRAAFNRPRRPVPARLRRTYRPDTCDYAALSARCRFTSRQHLARSGTGSREPRLR